MRCLALHGLPLGPRTWERLDLPLETVAFRGLATHADRPEWSLDGFVAEVLPHVDRDTVLLGHDLGGVVASMVALATPVRAVVLTGTALGPYWWPVRATALPGASAFFYRRYGGRLFLSRGAGEAYRTAFVAAMAPEIEAIPDLPERMRRMAASMRPPRGLARRLGARVPVHLVWGREDPWYPLPVARAVARGTGAALRVVPGGHYAMWEHPLAFADAVRVVLGWPREAVPARPHEAAPLPG